MNSFELRSLRQLARLQGIQRSYTSMAGETREASPETLMGLLGALGIQVEDPGEVSGALHEAQRARWENCLEPVIVCWNGKPADIDVKLPAHSPSVAFKLTLEEGQQSQLALPQNSSPAARATVFDGTTYESRKLALPPMPFGYHQLEAETPGKIHRALIVSAPIQSYSEPGQPRRWGVFLPMYAAHSQHSWGAGNFRDWQRLSQWTAAAGGTVAASLPLTAAFLDAPVCEPSPYSPASRLFWNEFYLDIEQIPEFRNCRKARKLAASSDFQRRLATFRSAREIDYCEQMALRRQVLQLLAETLFARATPRRREFLRFLRERPQVQDYARFRAACEQAKSSWHTWPERQRSGRLRPGDYAENAWRYHAYVQWIAHAQVQALVQTCRALGVSFYLDLPLGVHPDGYDVWREREAFSLAASAGAPPDPCFTKGQDWGFAPLHPRRIREQHYRYVLEYLRFQMRETGLLRIDHVMGLHRLFWIPNGLPPSMGAYVSYPAEELYALHCLESHRHRTILVGENLGTVPPEVNASMRRHRLRQMYVVQYEQRPDPREPLRPPPAECVASLNTHDMPTFAGYWQGADILDRARLGLIPKAKLPREKQQRAKANAALIRFLRRQGFLKVKKPSAEDVLRACLSWLGASPAEMLLVNLEDLWLELAPQNVPGTSTERPNWRRKARLTLEELERKPELQAFLKCLNAIISSR